VIEVHDATGDRWDDVATVMGTRGDASRCWCQFFRLHGPAAREATPTSSRAALRTQVVEDPVPPGVLAYADAEPVGWCAVAPRGSYSRLAHSEVTKDVPDEAGLWAVTCFVVRVGHRRQGVAGALLDAAVSLAERNGARIVEGYPVDTAVRKASSAELYHGTVLLFAAAGFDEYARPKPDRAVVRRVLTG
jgi:GNAT superfamily N-acetyltransferase